MGTGWVQRSFYSNWAEEVNTDRCYNADACSVAAFIFTHTGVGLYIKDESISRFAKDHGNNHDSDKLYDRLHLLRYLW